MSNISCGAQLIRSPSRVASCFKAGAVLGVAINPSEFPSLAYFVSADLYVQLQIPPQPACSKSASYTLKGSGLRVDARPTRAGSSKPYSLNTRSRRRRDFSKKHLPKFMFTESSVPTSGLVTAIRLSLILRVSFESGLCWVPNGTVMVTM